MNEEIYRRYFQDVYRYLLSLCRSETLAEELTQETFFKALEHIDGFNGQCRLYVWLCQIAKNTWISHCRRERHINSGTQVPESIGAGSPEGELLQREDARTLHRLLHALEEPYKEVFSLRLFGELPFAQIGELFGKSESWARVVYFRARRKLKEEYDEL